MTEPPFPQVSIILPMYMCEAYVNNALDMLCGQDLETIEIICVIDGSPDRTQELVQKYAEKDARVRVITQEHGGCGKARNTGLAAVRGKYLIVLDADDEFRPDYVSSLYNAAEEKNADIVLCLNRQTNKSTGIVYRKMGYALSVIPQGTVFDPGAIKNLYNAVALYPHNKIFKRELVEKNQLRFSETYSATDICFVCGALSCAKRITAIPNELYTYRMNENPSSINISRKQTDFLIAFNDLYEWLQSHDLWARSADNFISCWQDGLHYQAKFGTVPDFAPKVCEQIVSAEPWKSMDDRTLYRRLRLDLSIQKAKAAMISARGKMLKFLKKPADSCDHLLTRQMNEIRNITDIKEQLSREHGKDLRCRDNLIRSLIWTIQDEGASVFFGNAVQRLSALLKIR